MAPKSRTKQKLPKSQTPSSPYDFKRGAQVEISSNEEGFRGSWYLGTIIRRPSSKKPNEYLVRYDKLFKDETGKIPLEEVLECGHLRPLPPTEKDATFQFNEEVDAFHNDGWWEGVIVEESRDGKFGVFFTGTKEKIYFDKEDLRLHREWINGKWLPEVREGHISSGKNDPSQDEDQRETRQEESHVLVEAETVSAPVNITLDAGMLVEVSSDEAGLEGAWFPATIIELLHNGKFLVQHSVLRTEDDNDFLREEVASKFVRPRPPAIPMIDRFSILEEVDALYNDGWWIGVITEVLPDSKYRVYFKDSDEHIEFEHSDLRPHNEWCDGKWVSPSEKLSSGKRRKKQ